MAVSVVSGLPSISSNVVDQEYVYIRVFGEPLHSRVILSPACRVAGEDRPSAVIVAVS